jgi:hypothetical protein
MGRCSRKHAAWVKPPTDPQPSRPAEIHDPPACTTADAQRRPRGAPNGSKTGAAMGFSASQMPVRPLDSTAVEEGASGAEKRLDATPVDVAPWFFERRIGQARAAARRWAQKGVRWDKVSLAATRCRPGACRRGGVGSRGAR